MLRGLSLSVDEGEVVALCGANGAGKTTTLKAVMGLLPSEHGAVTDGQITHDGKQIQRDDPAAIVRRGVSLVMEGRRVFEHLTVHENLVAGGYTRRSPATMRDGKGAGDAYEMVYGYFPKLKDRRNLSAGYLSGGEQQMLAIGRALMAQPKLLLLDEPSLGLAPLIVGEIFDIIARLNADVGTTILLVEQNARRALEVANRGFIMEGGRIVLEGDATELAENPDVKEFYLGLGGGGARKSFRDVKHYRRRKRWL